jgi:hypothetical protein
MRRCETIWHKRGGRSIRQVFGGSSACWILRGYFECDLYMCYACYERLLFVSCPLKFIYRTHDFAIRYLQSAFAAASVNCAARLSFSTQVPF